jgi:uncharacterized protein (DUF433 family)
MVLPYALNLVAPYVGQKGRGPDLLTPRTLLRIIPGKLHGAPHVAGTRIPTAVLFTLAQQGYGVDDILEMYPDASREAVDQAIELEGPFSRRRNRRWRLGAPVRPGPEFPHPSDHLAMAARLAAAEAARL